MPSDLPVAGVEGRGRTSPESSIAGEAGMDPRGMLSAPEVRLDFCLRMAPVGLEAMEELEEEELAAWEGNQ